LQILALPWLEALQSDFHHTTKEVSQVRKVGLPRSSRANFFIEIKTGGEQSFLVAAV
jgi:hypothetical protein